MWGRRAGTLHAGAELSGVPWVGVFTALWRGGRLLGTSRHIQTVKLSHHTQLPAGQHVLSTLTARNRTGSKPVPLKHFGCSLLPGHTDWCLQVCRTRISGFSPLTASCHPLSPLASRPLEREHQHLCDLSCFPLLRPCAEHGGRCQVGRGTWPPRAWQAACRALCPRSLSAHVLFL